MKITPIASSSKGNAIMVDDGTTKVLLDAGVPVPRLQEFCSPSQIDGVLVSHGHKDHTRGLPALIRRGVKAYASRGCIDAMEPMQYTHFLLHEIKHLVKFELGSFNVLPFYVVHDTPEPMGFLLQSIATSEKLVYIVDSGYVKYDFRGVNYWLLEANHDEDIINESSMDSRLRNRIMKNHMSIQKVHKFLSTSDLSVTKQVHLLHLSDNNSDEEKFVTTIQKLTGCPVYLHP